MLPPDVLEAVNEMEEMTSKNKKWVVLCRSFTVDWC